MIECLGLCHFSYLIFDINVNANMWAEIYSAATGIPMDGEGLLKAAARGIDMRKAFNIREGASRKDDTMPSRFLTEPLKARDGMRPPYDSRKLDQMVTAYYEARGWDLGAGRHAFLAVFLASIDGLAAVEGEPVFSQVRVRHDVDQRAILIAELRADAPDGNVGADAGLDRAVVAHL